MVFPCTFTVTRWRDTVTTDRLGNPMPGPPEAEEIEVFGWAQPASSEPKLAGHERVVVNTELFAPPGVFATGDRVELPDGLFDVVGTPENYDHNPWWSPGLEVVNLVRVEG